MGQLPPETLKVFRIAQFTIQYLLNSQDMLSDGIQKMKSNSELINRVSQKFEAKIHKFKVLHFYNFADKSKNLCEIDFLWQWKNSHMSI